MADFACEVEYNQLNMELQNLVFQLETYGRSLDFYEVKGRENVKLIVDNALSSFIEGEIDYVEYALSTTEALRMVNEYIEILNNYNQTVIRLKYVLDIE